jgi:hypothetical protein
MLLIDGAAPAITSRQRGPKVPVRPEEVPEGRGRPTGALDPSPPEAHLRMKEVG